LRTALNAGGHSAIVNWQCGFSSLTIGACFCMCREWPKKTIKFGHFVSRPKFKLGTFSVTYRNVASLEPNLLCFSLMTLCFINHQIAIVLWCGCIICWLFHLTVSDLNNCFDWIHPSCVTINWKIINLHQHPPPQNYYI
jgi:hypothetical protein